MSRMSESCHISMCCAHTHEWQRIWMAHVTFQWCMSHTIEWCRISICCAHTHPWQRICMAHVTFHWVMSHMGESSHISMCCAHTRHMTTYVNGSCHILMSYVAYGWVVSRATGGAERTLRKLQYTKKLFSVSSDFSRFEWESLVIIQVSEYWVGISGDNPSFRIYKREKMHALLRLANVVSPFLYTRGECVMSHMNETCRTVWMSQVTFQWVMSHMNESYHTWMSQITYEWVM